MRFEYVLLSYGLQIHMLAHYFNLASTTTIYQLHHHHHHHDRQQQQHPLHSGTATMERVLRRAPTAQTHRALETSVASAELPSRLHRLAQPEPH